MHVQWIRCDEAFRRLAGEWDELLTHSACNHPFMSWTWMHHWWQHYGQDKRLALVTVRENGRLIGLAPLCQDTEPGRFGTRILRFMGTGKVCSEYLSFMLRNGHELDGSRAIVDFLCEQAVGRWDLLELTEMCTASVMTAAIEQALEDRNETYYCGPGWNYYLVRLSGSWEEYLKSVSSSRRGRVRRMIRRLEKDGGRFQLVERPEELPKAWDHLIRLHQLRWTARDEPGCFTSERFERFHRSLLEPMLAQGRLFLSVLYVGDEAIAANYALRTDGRVYCYQSGLDPAWGKYQPGHALTAFGIREATARGVRTYDLLGGDPQAKDRWANDVVPSCRFLIAAPRATARMHFARRLAVYHLKQGLKQRGPTWLFGALKRAHRKLAGTSV